jgi:hypothetical protein
MATNNCGTSNCGCTNTYTVTAPCPPSCPEVFNASCIVYTGTDILCNQDTVISRYDYLDTIITKLVNYICSVEAPVTVVVGSTYIDVSQNTVGNTTTYTVSVDIPALQAYFDVIISQTIAASIFEGPGIDVTVNPITNAVTISHEDTSTVANLSSNNSGNTFIQDIFFTFDTFGHVTGASVTPGSVTPPNDFDRAQINPDSGFTWGPDNDPTNIQIADAPGDTLNFVAGTGITLNASTVPTTDAIRITNSDPGSAVTLTSAGGTETLVNDSTGPSLATKGLTAGTGISLTGTATAITLTNTDPGSAVTLTDAGTGTHESLVNDGVGPALATKGLKAGTGISLSSTGTDITITNTVAPGTVQKYSTSTVLPGAGSVTITHNLGTLDIVVAVSQDGIPPLNGLTPGVDYTYTITSSNTIDVNDAAFGGGAIRVTVIG